MSVNILYNKIGVEQAMTLASILKEHPTLRSLCGNRGDEAELNMAGSYGKEMRDDGAIVLAPEIVANGALTSLNISSNNLGRYWDGSKGEYISDMTGVEALAAAIPECK